MERVYAAFPHGGSTHASIYIYYLCLFFIFLNRSFTMHEEKLA